MWRLRCPGAGRRNLCSCRFESDGFSMQARKVTENSSLFLWQQPPSEPPPVHLLLFSVGVVGREVQEFDSPLGYTTADLSFHRVMNQTLKVEQGQPNCGVQELLLMSLKCVMRLTYFSDFCSDHRVTSFRDLVHAQEDDDEEEEGQR